MALVTLKKRPEFLAIRGGLRASVPSFLIEAKARPAGQAALPEPRFGFTVTKKLGGAVVRNRIRRRIKAAITDVKDHLARQDFDYVVVARKAAIDRLYCDLLADAARALRVIHSAPRLPGNYPVQNGKPEVERKKRLKKSPT